MKAILAPILSPLLRRECATPIALAISSVQTTVSRSLFGIIAHASSTPGRPSSSRAITSASVSRPFNSRRHLVSAPSTWPSLNRAKSSAMTFPATLDISVPVSSAVTAMASSSFFDSSMAFPFLGFGDQFPEYVSGCLGSIRLTGGGVGNPTVRRPFRPQFLGVHHQQAEDVASSNILLAVPRWSDIPSGDMRCIVRWNPLTEAFDVCVDLRVTNRRNPVSVLVGGSV